MTIRRNKLFLGFVAFFFMFDDELWAQAPTKNPSSITVQSVTSNSASNSVTAGVIGQLNQTVLPSLVRGPQLEKFKFTFTEGAKLARGMNSGDPVNDDQIDLMCAAVEKWANTTYVWMNKDIGPYAAERFIYKGNISPLYYSLKGTHKDGYNDKFSSCYTSLNVWLNNIDILMRDPSIYPTK